MTENADAGANATTADACSSATNGGKVLEVNVG
jgi:hypothetical protein